MKRAIITGSEGFVGKYMQLELMNNGYDVICLDIIPGENVQTIDMLNYQSVEETLKKSQPDVIFHLAGQANVAASWEHPAKTFELNIISSINILEAIRKVDDGIKLVMIGSSDQYGKLDENGLSVDETLNCKPCTPYAISKKTQEEIGLLYAKTYGLHLCMTRSFNHGGAGQRLGFMIPDFCYGVARIEKGKTRELVVGNLDAKRDYTHVKDVVRAYRLIAESGKDGEIYNVGSGKSYSARDVLNIISQNVGFAINVKNDKERMRPNDTMVVCCNHRKLTEDTGWEPVHDIYDIVSDSMEYARSIVRS